MVSNCANPACVKPLLYLREGRIYVFDAALGTIGCGKKGERRLEHYWLCGACAKSLVLAQDAQGWIRILPKPRAVHDLGESFTSAAPSALRPEENLVSLPPKPRILVADDQRLVADMLVMILQQHGYETTAVYGGRLAVEKARQWRPGLFLSDVSMPEVDGIQAAIEIHAMLPECRILLFSGDPSCVDRIQEARLRGHSFEFLEKPIPSAALLKRIRRLRAA